MRLFLLTVVPAVSALGCWALAQWMQRRYRRGRVHRAIREDYWRARGRM